jgi:hypothetical protein
VTVEDIANNWGFPSEHGALSFVLLGKAQPTDEVTGAGTGNNPPSSPIPDCNASTVQVQHRGQLWRVGSTVAGRGSQVQSDQLARFNNHAEHQSRVSPLP